MSSLGSGLAGLSALTELTLDCGGSAWFYILSTWVFACRGRVCTMRLCGQFVMSGPQVAAECSYVAAGDFLGVEMSGRDVGTVWDSAVC